VAGKRIVQDLSHHDVGLAGDPSRGGMTSPGSPGSEILVPAGRSVEIQMDPCRNASANHDGQLIKYGRSRPARIMLSAGPISRPACISTTINASIRGFLSFDPSDAEAPAFAEFAFSC